jgi:hypothetical protein
MPRRRAPAFRVPPSQSHHPIQIRGEPAGISLATHISGVFSSARARILLQIAPGNGEEEPPPRTPAGVGFQSLATGTVRRTAPPPPRASASKRPRAR